MLNKTLKSCVILIILCGVACSGGGSSGPGPGPGPGPKPPTPQPNCLSGTPGCDPTTPEVIQGAVLYVTPRNNEIIAFGSPGQYTYTYNVDFLVDRTTTVAEVQNDISVTVPDSSGSGTQMLSGASVTVGQGNSYSGDYYTVSFSYSGNQAYPQALLVNGSQKAPNYLGQVKVCANGGCSTVSPVDITDTKLSVGFEANSRQGFGYGLYVSLLMPDYEMEPINASTFFSHVNSAIYTDLTPLLAWSEVDWEFVPMNSTLAGRNEFMLCGDPTAISSVTPCTLYWTNMGSTPTTVPVAAVPPSAGPATGYTLDYIMANSGALYPNGTDLGSKISSFDALEAYVLSENDSLALKLTPPLGYSSFDDSPHGVAINTALMQCIPNNIGSNKFNGAWHWGKVSDPNFKTDYPNAYELRKHFMTLNIIHSPYGNPASALSIYGINTRTDIDVTKIPTTATFPDTSPKTYVGHGLIGTEIYNELSGKSSAPRSLVGTAYSSPTGVVGPESFKPYKKFYYYAVNYTALSMDFYIIDPLDKRLNGAAVNASNISKFTPVRSFPIRDSLSDVAGSSVDHKYYGLMKFGLDEPTTPPSGSAGEGCNVQVFSYGAQGGFCSLKWQIQTWLIAGLAGSEYASSSLLANNYLKSIAVYPATGTKQEIDFTSLSNTPGDTNYWRYVFQQNFAIGSAFGPYLGDGTSYPVKGFWNLDFGSNPEDSGNALKFTQMNYQAYVLASNTQQAQGNYLYKLTASLKTQVVLDSQGYAYAAVDSYDQSETDVFSVPVGKTATVTVTPIVDGTPLALGAVSQTCTVTFGAGGTFTYSGSNCATPQFTIAPVNIIQQNLNAPSAVNPATMTGCSNGRCTFTVSWTNPASQYPSASFLVVPNQQWVSVPGQYYADLIFGGALVPAGKTSATFTVDQKYIGPSSPNVTIYACAGNSCPTAGNQYAVANIPGKSSTGGFDLQRVTSVSNPTFSGKTVTATWTNPGNQDKDAYCYINLTGVALSSSTGTYLQKCSADSGSITFSSAVSSGSIDISSCIKNSLINTCPMPPTYTPVGAVVNSASTGTSVLAPLSAGSATLTNCTSGRCTFSVSWKNPTNQSPSAQYFIVPNQEWVSSMPDYYADLITGKALLSTAATAGTSATFTLDQKYVGPVNPNVQVYACADSACPSSTNNYKIDGLPAVNSANGSSPGKDLSSITATPTSSTFSGKTLTVSWTNPAAQDADARCYVNVTGAVVSSVTPVACSSQTGSITASTLPSSADPKTFSVVACSNNSFVNTCPVAPSYTQALPAAVSPPANYGQTTSESLDANSICSGY